MCSVKLLIHSPISAVAPLKFRKGLIISSHILWWKWLLIHAGLKSNYVSKKSPWMFLITNRFAWWFRDPTKMLDILWRKKSIVFQTTACPNMLSGVHVETLLYSHPHRSCVRLCPSSPFLLLTGNMDQRLSVSSIADNVSFGDKRAIFA